jgi:hypothetical protein
MAGSGNELCLNIAIAADRRTVLRVNGVNLSGVRNASDFQPRVPVAGLFVLGAGARRSGAREARPRDGSIPPPFVCASRLTTRRKRQPCCHKRFQALRYSTSCLCEIGGVQCPITICRNFQPPIVCPPRMRISS